MARSDDDYDPGFDRPRRTAGGGRTAIVLVVVFVVLPILLVVTVCGGVLLWGWHLASPTWHDYRPNAGSWTAQFPQPSNKVQTSSRREEDGRTYEIAECVYGFPPSTFTIRSSAVTAEEEKIALSTLLTIADHWKSNSITETYRTDDSQGDQAILSCEYVRGDNTIVLKAIIVGDRLFVLTVDSPIYDSTDDPVIDFFNRFAPTGPKAP
jgi:cytoskeletal protein RodZ